MVACVLIVGPPVRAQGSRAVAAPQAAVPASVAAVKKSGAKPQKSVKNTLKQAIKALEAYDCVTVAVDFLNPIKRAQIQDLEAYKTQRQCSATNKGNLDEALLAMKLALGGVTEHRGITATISLEGVGLKIQKVTLVKYLDGRWYFNDM
jgi:hypothetical protein